MAINAQNRTLPDWFTRIRTRQLVLPRFQRFEAWGHSQIMQLFNTILQDLPIGAVLILEIGDEEPFVSRPVVTAPEEGERINEHLLDGQQRLTALWRGLHNNYQDRTYFVRLQSDEETDLPYSVITQGRWKQPGDSERRPFWANNPRKQWEERRVIPLEFFAPTEGANKAYKAWAKEAIPDPEEREEISETRVEIREKFTTFNLPFLSLPVTTKKDTALNVFMNMNTSAQALRTYDIVVAQFEANTEGSLHDLVAAAREECPTIEAYYDPEPLVLYASALLQGRSTTNSSFMSRDFVANLHDHWDEMMRGISRTAQFLEDERIFDEKRLPSDVVVPILVAIWANAPTTLDKEGRARTILRKYLWRAFFSNRYERSTNSRTLTDFNELRALINNEDAPEPTIFDSERTPLPETGELVNSGWPKNKNRLARAILALSLRQGGHDLADGSTVGRNNLGKREYHHLFPASYLEERGYSSSEVYSSLNCALVTWQTNRNISAKEPARYLEERLENAAASPEQVRQRLATHLIPYDEMVQGDYQAFLNKRAELVRERMLAVCEEGEAVH